MSNNSLLLRRICRRDDSVLGVLLYRNAPILVTLEDPLLFVPAGSYRCVPHNGPHIKGVWELQGVNGREGILIHGGNTEADTEGCILVGRRYGDLNGKPAVLDSQVALDFLRYIAKNWTEFQLTIEDFAS